MKNINRALGLLVVLAAACSNSNEVNVDGDNETVGATASAVTVSDYTLPMTALNGTYTGCKLHADGDKWSVEMATGGPALANPPLRVKKNDAGCVLNVTEARDNATPAVTFAADSPIALDVAFASAARSFSPGGDLSKRFYGNAKISGLAFNTNFNILFVYSDKASDVAVNKGSSQYVVGTATSQLVPASDMTLDLSALNVDTDVNDVVTGLTGNANLGHVTVDGDSYLIANGPLPISWKLLDDMFVTSAPADRHGIGPIPAASFLSVGDTLPKTKVLIVQHYGTGNVSSYQTFTITFTP